MPDLERRRVSQAARDQYVFGTKLVTRARRLGSVTRTDIAELAIDMEVSPELAFDAVQEQVEEGRITYGTDAVIRPARRVRRVGSTQSQR